MFGVMYERAEIKRIALSRPSDHDLPFSTWSLSKLAELNRIEPQFTARRYFALDGTDHPSHTEQGRMIRRYISWRNRNACDDELRKVLDGANIC